MSADARSRAKASTAKAALGALSLLVIGGVLGVAIDRHLLSKGDHGPAAAFHEAVMTSLEERLDLEPAQRRQIDSILAAHHRVLQQTWQTLGTQLGATVDTVHRDVEAVLTPEQRAEFREWVRGTQSGS
jgi:hypothetical protein